MITFTKDTNGFTFKLEILPKCFINHNYSKWHEPYALNSQVAEQRRMCCDCGKVQVRRLNMYINNGVTRDMTYSVEEYNEVVKKYNDLAMKYSDLADDYYKLSSNTVLTNDDKEHLQFIYGRLSDVYFENERVDYMVRFDKIINGSK